MSVALLLATISSANATAELIGDTYVISAFAARFDANNQVAGLAAFTEAYRGTFDADLTPEVIGANPLGNDGDQLLVLEEFAESRVGNQITRAIRLSIVAVDANGDPTNLLGSNANTELGGDADTLLFDLGTTNDPLTGEVDPLDASIPFATDYALDLDNSTFSLTDLDGQTFDVGFLTPPSFDDGPQFASGGGARADNIAGFRFFGLSQTYVYSATVPEPSSFAAFGVLGLGGLVYRRRKSRADRVEA